MRTLLLTLFTLLPFTAQAQSFCGQMGNPATELKYISRGFAHGHTGLDMMAAEGSPIHAAAGGTVVYAGVYFAYGKIVDIQHADGVVTRYAHMQAFASGIAPGSSVSAGALIGKVGHTGHAHGSHVHFEVRIAGRPVDPRPYLALVPCTGVTEAPLIEEAEVPAARVYRKTPPRKAQH
jgi:murein DD-endopeptidase MepM/ murein hydrolase activator NlpD